MRDERGRGDRRNRASGGVQAAHAGGNRLTGSAAEELPDVIGISFVL